ncbi:hypothetical protein [Microbacterium sp. NIBRBAC000506063]|uniref:hypothetical protein n=1 Tax=Microbacterium sp. NIBRBAC000506063 TaxID=2734618 RepID=UPI001BB56F37|nr:hypothetical protein [Microbacterium sp. NIBRBAC000506063]QTV78998.1 hypothetical protein KAE78_07380 [Microbacterium sp. NIBRBAC000506063]
MGLFQQKPEEHQVEWAGLPSEPLDPKSAAEALEEAPAVDPFALGFESTTIVAFPVAPPAPEASDAATAEPEDPAQG